VLELAWSALWVPETRCTSRDLLILVKQPAESVAPLDVVDLGCCAPGQRSQGSGLAETAVWPVIV
jgi:hypothetical protein